MRTSWIWLALLSPIACNVDSAATFRLAVGWTGGLPTWQGSCATDGLATGAVVPRSGAFVAQSPGTVDLACDKGVLRLEVQEPTALAITPAPKGTVGKPVIVTAEASNAAGTLDLGDAEIVWSLADPLRRLDRCAHMGSCLQPKSARIVADRAGKYPVTATFGELAVTSTLTFE